MNPTSLGITLKQITHESCEIGPFAMTPSLDEAFATFRLNGDKDTARAATTILVVLLSRLAWYGRLEGTRIVQELIRLPRRNAKSILPTKGRAGS